MNNTKNNKSHVNPIPKGYHGIIPYLIVKNANGAIKFYQELFDAKELYRLSTNDIISHAELIIQDSKIMLADENLNMGLKSPNTIGGTPITLVLFVTNVDDIFNKAIKMNANVKIVRQVENQFYGDRMGEFIDPFGIQWSIGTHVENVSEEEIIKRYKKITTEALLPPSSRSTEENFKKKYLKYKQKYSRLRNSLNL